MAYNSHCKSKSADILNGARCGPYSWSQSREDLQIRVKLRGSNVKYEHLNVLITKHHIKVELRHWDGVSEIENKQLLVNGNLEHSIDQESAYWLIENEDEPSIVIYVDKSEGLWWRKLFVNEEPIEVGPMDRTVIMDHLDDGSRMMIDKLIVDQRNKLIKSNKKL